MRFLLLSIVVLECMAAHASDIPVGSAYDNRIKAVAYNPGDVVVLKTAVGLAQRIIFAQDETIKSVASGFSQGWEFQERQNVLIIKARSVQMGDDQPPISPKTGEWDTNLLVTTSKRHYDFDLVLVEGSSKEVAYRVEFLYPAEEAAKKAFKDSKEVTTKQLDIRPVIKNTKYTMRVGKNAQEIAPTQAYDDGRFTYLKFPNNRDFPAVFTVSPDKSESIINSHIDSREPDVLVVHRVAKEIILRHGKAVVGVFNNAYDPDGVPPVDGTTVPDVKRVIKVTGEEQ